MDYDDFFSHAFSTKWYLKNRFVKNYVFLRCH